MNDSTNTYIPAHIELQPVVSSQIAAVGFDPSINTLAVQFSGSPGRTYHYFGVTPETHHEFVNAESIGSFFYKNINFKYGFARIEADGTVSKMADAEKPADPASVIDQPADGGTTAQAQHEPAAA